MVALLHVMPARVAIALGLEWATKFQLAYSCLMPWYRRQEDQSRSMRERIDDR